MQPLFFILIYFEYLMGPNHLNKRQVFYALIFQRNFGEDIYRYCMETVNRHEYNYGAFALKSSSSDKGTGGFVGDSRFSVYIWKENIQYLRSCACWYILLAPGSTHKCPTRFYFVYVADLLFDE